MNLKRAITGSEKRLPNPSHRNRAPRSSTLLFKKLALQFHHNSIDRYFNASIPLLHGSHKTTSQITLLSTLPITKVLHDIFVTQSVLQKKTAFKNSF